MHTDCGKPRKAPTPPRRAAPAEGGEILHWRRGMGPPASPRPGSLRPGRGEALLRASGDGRHPRGEALGLALHLAARGLDLPLEVATVRLHRAHRLVPALPKLALDPRAGPLHLAHRAVAGGGAAALELAEVDADALLEARQLALRALATLGVGTGHVDHRVTGLEGRADRNQDRALGLLGDRLDAERRGAGAPLSGVLGVGGRGL